MERTQLTLDDLKALVEREWSPLSAAIDGDAVNVDLYCLGRPAITVRFLAVAVGFGSPRELAAIQATLVDSIGVLSETLSRQFSSLSARQGVETKDPVVDTCRQTVCKFCGHVQYSNQIPDHCSLCGHRGLSVPR